VAPGKAFSIKGAALGLALSGVGMTFGILKPLAGFRGDGVGRMGSSHLLGLFVHRAELHRQHDFTSMSGVKREMRFAIPIQTLAAAAGVALLIASGLIGGR
jgi:hypothetical protein